MNKRNYLIDSSRMCIYIIVVYKILYLIGKFPCFF